MTRVERLDEEIAVFLLTRAGKRKCRGTSSSCIAKYKEFAILLISISLDDAHPRSKIDIYLYSHECRSEIPVGGNRRARKCKKSR